MTRGFQGMPGKLGELVKQAQKMQEQIQKAQASAEQLTTEGSSGGGMVRVVVNGSFQIVSLSIEPQVVNPTDVQMLEDLIIAACNDALAKAQEVVKAELSKATGGMSIPGLF